MGGQQGLNKKELAKDELKILQDIIARHDDISFKIKSWCITLNIGILAAFYGINSTEAIKIPLFLIFPCLILIDIFFLWIDAVYRVAMNRAMKRSATIEKQLRKNKLKKYPKINKTFNKPNKLRDQFLALKNIRVTAPYIIILFIDLLVLFIKK
jgi:hypothetical protein